MKRRPTKRTATIERPPTQPQRRAPNIRPGGTNFTPVSDAIMFQMNQAMSTQAPETATKLYPPGAPIKPVPGFTPLEGPRGWVYPVNTNVSQLPRATEAYSFADLRAMASTYYGIQMCQQVWFDYISKLELAISPRPELVGEDEDVSQYENDIQSYQDFFAFPDKELDLKAWLRKAVKDQLEIDAVAIYMRKDKAGRPFSLDLLDGSMIKPLIDDRGRRPLPPYPAYEQYWNGIPACLLTSDDLIYIKETERTDSVYGMSRVEKILLNVNIALRKQTKDLARFTDGTMPAGFISPEMDVTWSQEEIEAYEIQVNNMLAGNDELRARLKVLPRGFSYIRTDDPDIHVDLDTHLLNITAAMHGLTMAELAFIADVNRSSGETQENVVYRRAMGPLMARYADLFTMILRKYFRENRFICHWKGFGEHEDLLMQAQAYSTLTNAGILGLTNANKLMKLPEDPDAPYIGRVFFSKDGPIFLDDMAQDKMRSAMMDAKLAGLQLPQQAASGEATAPTEEEKPEDEDEEEQPPTRNTSLSSTRAAQKAQTPVHTGIMVAFMLDLQTANELALSSGEPACDMHITLAYLGDMSDYSGDFVQLLQAVSAFASEAIPLQGNISGVARFAPSDSSEGKAPVVALVNVKGIHEWRGRLVKRLQSAGYSVASDFEYTPHITLAYVDADADMPIDDVPALPLMLDTVTVCLGDDRHAFKIGDEQYPQYWEEKQQKASPQNAERERLLDLKRWRDRALEDLKRGKPRRDFLSTAISVEEQAIIRQALATVRTADEVKAVFERAKERDTRPKAIAAFVSGGNPQQYKNAWNPKW